MVLTASKENLFSAGLDQQIKFWNLATKTELYRLEGHSNVVYTLKLDPFSNVLYSGSEDGSIRTWDLKSKKMVHSVNGLNSALSSLCIGKQGLIVSVDSEKREIIRVYNALGKEFVGRFDGHKDEIFALQMTSDEKRVFSAGNDRTIKIWNYDTRRIVKSVLAHSKCINCLLLSSNDKYLFSCSDDCYIKIWSIYEHDLIIFAGINHGCQVLTIKLSRDNRTLFSGGKSSKPVKTWDVESLQYEYAKGKKGEIKEKLKEIKPLKTLEESGDSKEDVLNENLVEEKANSEKKGTGRPKKGSLTKEVKKETVECDENSVICHSKGTGKEKQTSQETDDVPKKANSKGEKSKRPKESILIDEKGKNWLPKLATNEIKVVPVGLEDSVMVSNKTVGSFSYRRREEQKLKKEITRHSNDMENLIIQEKTDNRYRDKTFICISEETERFVHIYLSGMRHFLQARTNTEKKKVSDFWQKSVQYLSAFFQFKLNGKVKKNEIELIRKEKMFVIDKEHLLIVMKAIVSNFSRTLSSVNEEILLYDKKLRKSMAKGGLSGSGTKKAKESVAVVYDLHPENEKMKKTFNDRTSDRKWKKGPEVSLKTIRSRDYSDKQVCEVEKKTAAFLEQIVHPKSILAEGPVTLKEDDAHNDIEIVTPKSLKTARMNRQSGTASIKKKEEDIGLRKLKVDKSCYVYHDIEKIKTFNHVEELNMMEKMLKSFGSKMNMLRLKIADEKIRELNQEKMLDFLKKRKTKLESREYNLQKRCIQLSLVEINRKKELEEVQNRIEFKERDRISLQEKLESMNQQVKDLKSECQDFKKKFEASLELEENLKKKMKEEKSQLNAKLAEVSTELTQMKSKNEQLGQENQNLRESGEERTGASRMETSCFEEFIGFLKKENTDLKEEYGSIKRKYDTLKEESRAAMYSSKLAQFEKAKLEHEKSTLKEKLGVLLEKYKTLQKTLASGQVPGPETCNSSVTNLFPLEILNTSLPSNAKPNDPEFVRELLGKRDDETITKSNKKNQKVNESIRSSVSVNNTRFLKSVSHDELKQNMENQDVKEDFKKNSKPLVEEKSSKGQQGKQVLNLAQSEEPEKKELVEVVPIK